MSNQQVLSNFVKVSAINAFWKRLGWESKRLQMLLQVTLCFQCKQAYKAAGFVTKRRICHQTQTP